MVCVVRIALIRIGNSSAILARIYPESDTSEIRIGYYIRVLVLAVIILRSGAEPLLIVVAIAVAIRDAIALIAANLLYTERIKQLTKAVENDEDFYALVQIKTADNLPSNSALKEKYSIEKRMAELSGKA